MVCNRVTRSFLDQRRNHWLRQWCKEKSPLFCFTCVFPIALTACLSTSPSKVGDQQCGEASWYGKAYAGRPTASGERFLPEKHTAAHPSIPFGSLVRVENQTNGLSVHVRINDRGPYADGRIIDLSHAAFSAIASPSKGVVPVCLKLLARGYRK